MSGAPAGRVNVLLVDDHPQLRRLLALTMEGEGFAVTQADTADQALKMLEDGLTPDLLVSDVRVPGNINGLELARSARRMLPSIRVLLQTGFTDLKVSEFRVLHKPFNPTELADCLREVLGDLPAAAR